MKKVVFGFLTVVGSSLATPVFMDGEYAKALCEVWNNTPRLVDELGKSESWTSVGERKIFIYREDCDASKQIQLTIKNEGGKARCVYGGPAKDKRGKDDFLMYAETKRWEEMARGEYGPMKAMMLGRLKFEGPKFVAMKNMGPFEAFLTALGKPKYDAGRCP
ncbi:Sterol-binding domain protein [Thermocrinis albus DSM 14484]|uniref:Sterol-binding domain protein n=1 Tax=Thermocrinis albus (strain DSM 14484 / JCM 11386 / HI 11/12) TaxID=638303 RepID=D3SLF1_THEAH|nr:SCP2 sterol-binding domain-containing protein [Thermocrinis albus]ADC89581.1 Sterol-binding domain protein [Thermocrinis albus DSM 14484]